MNYPEKSSKTADRPEKEVFITSFNRAIGDHLEEILSGIDFAGLKISAGKSAQYSSLLALVTIMQFVEDLPDEMAAEATGRRMDWKYALHLPVYFPGLEPAILDDFRHRLKEDQAGLQVFQQLLDHLAQAGLLGCRGQQTVKAGEVLDAVCSLSRLARLLDGFCQTIETLAASQADWLLKIALPHWFNRYRREQTQIPLPHDRQKQEEMANLIGSDICYLLRAIDQSGLAEIASLPEVSTLRNLWFQQYEPGEKTAHWRLAGCASCSGDL